MTTQPFMAASRNLSVAWAETFVTVARKGAAERGPVIVSVEDFADGSPVEDSEIRVALDDYLVSTEDQEVHTVANTIFPERLWNPNEAENAEKLFERHDRIWPALKRHNRRGQYFRRLTQFQPKDRAPQAKPVNQLKHIIDTYQTGNHRRSALQAVIFDPTRDHTNSQQQGFPCLEEVSFIPDDKGHLTLTGIYTVQYCFEKAYGNYLGLCRLGRFMAAQMGLSLVRMTCIAVVMKHGDQKKTLLEPLVSSLESLLRDKQ
jgi:thymidylate synthase